jgi:hypothetical protein
MPLLLILQPGLQVVESEHREVRYCITQYCRRLAGLKGGRAKGQGTAWGFDGQAATWPAANIRTTLAAPILRWWAQSP